MRLRVAVPEAHAEPPVIDAALEAVTRLDESMIRSGHVPDFDSAKHAVRWRPENMGDEHFDHAAIVMGRGWGDCDDLAPWKAATLRATGQDPGAYARVVPSGPSTYHAIVQRTDGSIDDPSIECGMRPKGRGRVSGGCDGESIEVHALDPHDGRIYSGSLFPTQGPLAMHPGPVVGVRPVTVIGGGMCFEGRCDLPIVGSPLVRCVMRRPGRVRVHAYSRRRPFRVMGESPYAFSMSAYGYTPHDAMIDAVGGAILCGDASEVAATQDRYKLLAFQGLMAGLTYPQIVEAIAKHMKADAEAARSVTGCVVGDFLDYVGDAAAVAAPIAGGALGGPLGAAAGGALGQAIKGAAQGGPGHYSGGDPIGDLIRGQIASQRGGATPATPASMPGLGNIHWGAPSPAPGNVAVQWGSPPPIQVQWGQPPAVSPPPASIAYDLLSAMYKAGSRGAYGPVIVRL